jgi:hypothetical protein
VDTILLILLGVVFALGAVWARGRYWDFLAQTPGDYAEGRAGHFDLRTHLNGPVQCEGLIYGPTGRVSSRFVARFDCSWTGNVGVMKEVFDYDDGSQQHREWHLTLGNDGRIVARASDVVGDGVGAQSGDSVQLKYKIRLPEASGGHVLDTVDWMYLAPNGTIINRSQFRKYGIKVAELVATMRPMEEKVRRAA